MHKATHVNDLALQVTVKIFSKVVNHFKVSTSPFPTKSPHSSRSFSSATFYKKTSPLIQAHRTLLPLEFMYSMVHQIFVEQWDMHRRRQWHPTPVLLPGKSHGWRSLEGCNPWGRWGLDMTERLHFHFQFSLSCIGEGNGNPLQCSCLENPRNRGAWWAAVYGVPQSRTRLKWLSSSSRDMHSSVPGTGDPMERTYWPLPCWSTLHLYHVAYHPSNDGSSYPLKKKSLSWEGSCCSVSLT